MCRLQIMLAAHILTFLAIGVRGRLYNAPSEFNISNMEYDFIVVGSGPGGATVASRLSEDSTFRVLLIEAGPNDEGINSILAPGLEQTIPDTYNWNYTTTPTNEVANRSLPYRRGFVLGGTSSINGMVYTRGVEDDYNTWASISGDDGWRWENMWPLMLRNERLVPPTSGRDTTGNFDPAFHSLNGTLEVSLAAIGPTDFDQRVLNVTVNEPETFPFSLDVNSGRPLGITWAQFTVGGGERRSASTGFLPASVRARDNLDILVNTQVTRVLNVGQRDVEARASDSPSLDMRAVEIGDRATGSIIGNVTASKEVILSAGVINTPQILLHSGIGDPALLSSVGVPIIHELVDVGRNMDDHPSFFAIYNATTNEPPAVDAAAALAEWTAQRTGPLAATRARHIVWSRISDNSSIWDTFPDPSSGIHTPQIEMVPAVTPDLLGTFMVLLNPTSRGRVTINSTNPFSNPVIDAPILKTDYDVLAITEGIRLVERFFAAPSFRPANGDSYILNATFPSPDSLPPIEWEAYLRTVVGSGAHGVGTAAMSSKGAVGGVVNPDLRVKGVIGLRIVDASVIPHVPAAHTQAPTYFVAERAVDLIRSQWAA